MLQLNVYSKAIYLFIFFFFQIKKKKSVIKTLMNIVFNHLRYMDQFLPDDTRKFDQNVFESAIFPNKNHSSQPPLLLFVIAPDIRGLGTHSCPNQKHIQFDY
jgi:hypothetical protein